MNQIVGVLLQLDRRGENAVLKHGILGLLNYHQMTGYEIMLVFRDSLHFFWSAQTSQIYRELQTLEAKGWVSKTAVEQQGKPDKNIYTITAEGREELLSWLSGEEVDHGFRNAILMKVFFLGERSPAENIRYFESIVEYYGIVLQGLDEAQKHIEEYRSVVDDAEKALYWEMTLDYGRRNMQLYIDWAQNCIERLKGER